MIGVAILGYGTVGSGVQKILSENRGHIARMVGDEVRLTHVVDIRPLSNMPPEVVVTQRYEDVLEADEVKIVVECIGGAVAEVVCFLPRASARRDRGSLPGGPWNPGAVW